MIGKKTLKDYDFKTITDYFSHIVDSHMNGQRKQMKNLIHKLSHRQFVEFLNWLDMENCELSVTDILEVRE